MAQTPKKLTANLAVTHYDFDPGATTLTDIAWVDMQGFECLLVSFFRTIGTADVVMKIIANSESDGSGTDVVVATKTFSAQPDAVGDYVFLEVTAEMVKAAAVAAGVAARYVSAQVSVATGTDEGVVTYIRKPGRFSYEDMTADVIA